MAIALDNSSITNGNGTHPQTVSFTVGSGSNRILFAILFGGDSDSAPTYNGATMTKVQSYYYSPYWSAAIYVYMLLNPDSGTHDFYCSDSGMQITESIALVSFSGCSQTYILDAAAETQNTGSSGHKTLNITTVANNCWVLTAFNAITMYTDAPTSDQTLRGSNQYSASFDWSAFSDTNGPVTPAGSKTVGYTMSANGSRWTYIITALSFAPAAAAASSSVGLVGDGLAGHAGPLSHGLVG